MKGFVNKLTSELEKLSVSSPPPKKNVTSVNATNAIVKNETYSAISDTAQPSSTNRPLSAATPSIAQSSPITRHITNNNEFNDISLKVHDNPVANNSTSSNQLPTQNYEASQFLAILQQSITKPQGNTHHHDGVATYVDERLNNLEQALSIRESKGEVFSRLRQVEERVLKIEESQNMGVASQKQEASNDSANENAREATMPPMNETPYNSDEFFFNDELDNFCFTMDVDPPLRSGDSHDHHHHEEDDFSLFE
ncbi:hypothetical protein C9374_002915 [Naegleria lovaniensis]|uniref:Uncharacterized protein n=1 Tax=Naegleria lovaniensis TaxID=51637 RepID=A0AA88KLW5_NAELO|nr:uncharacterized protein C9374_002915 [Naegleria lovaniensis]KAG2385766.1 hypothetical protein C9374_002915 [Naegleria lovaniensis]